MPYLSSLRFRSNQNSPPQGFLPNKWLSTNNQLITLITAPPYSFNEWDAKVDDDPSTTEDKSQPQWLSTTKHSSIKAVCEQAAVRKCFYFVCGEFFEVCLNLLFLKLIVIWVYFEVFHILIDLTRNLWSADWSTTSQKTSTIKGMCVYVM